VARTRMAMALSVMATIKIVVRMARKKCFIGAI
jgi:hypothetical protein